MEIKFKAGKGVPLTLKKLGTIRTKIISQASNAALNKAAVSVEAQAVKIISTRIGLAPRKARQLIDIERSSTKTLRAIVIPSRRPLNLIEYVAPRMARPGAFRVFRGKLQRGGGVVATAWGDKKTYKGTFIVAGQNSGKPVVVSRKSADSGNRKGWSKTIYGPSVKQEFLKDTLRRAMRIKARDAFLKNYEHELNYRLGKIKNG